MPLKKGFDKIFRTIIWEQLKFLYRFIKLLVEDIFKSVEENIKRVQ